MAKWMNGWMDRWMTDWSYGYGEQMDEWMARQMDGIYGQMDGYINCMAKWMDTYIFWNLSEKFLS